VLPQILLLLPLLGDPPASAASPSEMLSVIAAAVLQGNGPRALSIISGIPATGLSPQATQIRECLLSRLDGSAPPAPAISPLTHQPDAFATQALDIYRSYWRDGVNHPEGRAAAQQKLLLDLTALLGDAPLKDLDDAEPLLAARLAQGGFHSLGGQTGLMRDLFLWTEQREQMESVPLPEGAAATKVFYLDGFVSRGWSSYFMCDLVGTGGWAKPEGLYVVVPGYQSLNDEDFRVNFLAHESQHYVDYRHFPGLAGWELEYRAKLVELVYADKTRENELTYFITNQGNDPADAHSYADKQLVAALRARLKVGSDEALKSVPGPALQQAARAELRADTARREKAAGKH
jgi:hypothetical protein